MSAEQTHGPECACTRCRGFEPGNELRFREGNQAGLRHGSYSMKLGPRALEIAEVLTAAVPGGDPTDSVAIEAAAMVLARLERASMALDEVDAAAGERALGAYVGSSVETLGRLRQDARGWANVALRFLDALALVPTSRGRLGLDVARMRQLDLSKLSDRELSELEALVERAGEVGPDA